MERSPFFFSRKPRNTSSNGPCSIAMLVYWSVIIWNMTFQSTSPSHLHITGSNHVPELTLWRATWPACPLFLVQGAWMRINIKAHKGLYSSMAKWWSSLLHPYLLGVVSSGKGFWKHTFISFSPLFAGETVKTHRSWSRYKDTCTDVK